MEQLKDFKSKPFPEQMLVLTGIGSDKDPLFLPGLFRLYNELTGDKTVDAMVEHTLRDILMESEEETVKKIPGGAVKEKKLCIQVAGKQRFPSAVPVLMELTRRETEEDVLVSVFIAMSEIKDPLFLDIFREQVHHSNEIIAGICIKMMGIYDDTASIGELGGIIEEAQSEAHYHTCAVSTAEAIETLGKLATAPCIKILVSYIHHKNPTARRIVQEELVRIGEEAVPFFKDIFSTATEDAKIMAANVLGGIGHRNGTDILVAALDHGLAETLIVKAAIYEAFGEIHSMKGLVCLIDALTEENPQVLITVVAALDRQVNPGMIQQIDHMIHPGQSNGENIIEAIVGARALNIFLKLYPDFKEQLIPAVLKSNDAETLEAFGQALETVPGDNAAADREDIHARETRKSSLRILAVDDSRSMILFYRKVISSMGLDITALLSAGEALDIIGSGESFNLVITDMNMPGMDGLEFTRSLRMNPDYENIPIIMATTESDTSQVQLAENSGVTAFLTKPIRQELLMEKIKGYLEEGGTPIRDVSEASHTTA
ncbi:MAG: response regulator [bacterium]|nr:response regulator [bacterium]